MPTRAEHRRKTLVMLNAAAVSLFEVHGPGVTIEAIAQAAGVSRRTVFRYVQSKQELVYLHPVLWFEIFEDALVDCGDASLADRLHTAGLAIAAAIDADPEPVLRSFRLALAHPEALASGFNAVFQRWIDRIADVVPQGDQRVDRFRARVVGSAMMGLVDASLREWLRAGGSEPFIHIFDGGFGLLRPLFEGVPQGS